MILPLLFAFQAVAGPAAPPVQTPEQRYDLCVDQAVADPERGIASAGQWRIEGGGFLARQCLGMSYASLERWSAAGEAFEDAARSAEVARDARSANYWAQAGNAWLADGNATRARAAIDAALAAGTLTGLALGEAHLDRARILVAAGDPTAARIDLDQALVGAKADPLAWLLSATLARRQGDLARARTDIAEAVRRAPDDAAVQLEAGHIAGLSGDLSAARRAYAEVQRLAPDSVQARAAQETLATLPTG